MASLLVIGTWGIAHKDQMVLRALMRLFEGGVNINARFSEMLEECNVVFVPSDASCRFEPPCVAVRVADPEKGAQAFDHHADDLIVSAPLRMTNVIAVLQSAAQRLQGVVQHDPVQGLQTLFDLLSEGMRKARRGLLVVPASPGQQIVFDFVGQIVRTSMSMEVLLSGAYTLGKARRVNPVEEELIRALPVYSLRPLLWSVSTRLAQIGAIAPTRSGSYRLLRWPDASGLGTPGHPRLSALWTHRAMSLAQIDAKSGVAPSTTRWFLETCLALDLAVVDSGSDSQIAASMASATSTRSNSAGWLGHLRERLKLW